MRLALVLAVGCFTALTASSTAFAAQPTPRGPIGGCGADFAVTSVAELTERFPRSADFFLQTDANLDGFICNKFFRSMPGGVAVDNTAVGRT